MSVWERIHEAIARTIKEEDKAFEISYLRFGAARKWLVQQIDLNPNWLILEIGYGQGYFTAELASSLGKEKGKVIGIDLLNDWSTTRVTKYISKQLGLKERIDLVNCDSTRLPFRDASFDVVTSFLAFQNVVNTRGSEGVLSTINEACRVVRKDGIVAFADDSFPSCSPYGEQGILFKAIRRHWRTLLPSTKTVIEQMEKNGISNVKVLTYNPTERLLPQDAERELRLSVGWAKPLGVEVNFDEFWKEVGEIVGKQGRVFSQVVLLLSLIHI